VSGTELKVFGTELRVPGTKLKVFGTELKVFGMKVVQRGTYLGWFGTRHLRLTSRAISAALTL
jgi:hypothetical protein